MDQEIQFIKIEGVISIVEPVPEWFLGSIFLAKKKDRGNQPVINLKDLNGDISFVHLQKFFLLKKMLMPRGPMCKIDLKDAYFAVTLAQKTQKYLISMDGSTERVSLSMFWSVFSCIAFYKNNENPCFSFEKALRQNYNIPRQDAPYGNQPRGPANFSGHFNILSPVSGFPHRYKGNNFNTYINCRTSRHIRRFSKITLSLPKKKVENLQTQCRDYLKRKQLQSGN